MQKCKMQISWDRWTAEVPTSLHFLLPCFLWLQWIFQLRQPPFNFRPLLLQFLQFLLCLVLCGLQLPNLWLQFLCDSNKRLKSKQQQKGHKMHISKNIQSWNLVEIPQLLHLLFWRHYFVFTFLQAVFQLCALLLLLFQALGLFLHLLLNFIQLLHSVQGRQQGPRSARSTQAKCIVKVRELTCCLSCRACWALSRLFSRLAFCAVLAASAESNISVFAFNWEWAHTQMLLSWRINTVNWIEGSFS